MELVWGTRNREKVEAHGLSIEEVESVFDSGDFGTMPSEEPYRFIAEGTAITNRLIRVIYAETGDGLYPITAFPIRAKQRRTR